jgi:mannose PTS system EIID component
MSGIPPRARRAALLRSFAVQGSWNYETMLGTGFALMLAPLLRAVYRDDPAGLRRALERHSSLFNCHPYLAALAAGAVARLEADRVDPALIERFKSAMRASLGSLGDQLVWQSWRPACAVVGIALLLLGFPWWAAVAAFLVPYNALNFRIRGWGLETGITAGLDVARAVREAPIALWARRATQAGAIVGGVACAAAFRGVDDLPSTALVALVALPLGLWLGAATRRVVWAALSAAWVAGLAYSITTAPIG